MAHTVAQNAATRSRIYGAAQTILLCVFAGVYLLDGSRPLFVSRAWRDLGLLLCAGGIVLMLAALRTLRTVVQIEPAPKTGGELVTRGVYGWLRHPIYTAILMLLAGLFLREATVPVAVTAVVVAGFLLIKVRFEEVLLAARYPGYAAYRQRTWGIVPGFGRTRAGRDGT